MLRCVRTVSRVIRFALRIGTLVLTSPISSHDHVIVGDQIMSQRRGDSRRFVPVEASDGRLGFDGNDTRRIVSWLIPHPGKKFEPLADEQVEQLMDWTAAGHLAWVVFPIDNDG